MPYTTFYIIKVLKKCFRCKKRKGKIVINQIVDNCIKTSSLCIPCFKIKIPEYTLKNKCFICPDCFKCNFQKIIFTSKEINRLKITLNHE
ncbi:hypothetical protein LCGC14_1067730 [marine sediment metagenome]|uniref:Uncharacterized protein n=1 Tax=marine sediment metagenome TaxID=412755 RepID=A0A0F9MP32_9ZZZZ